MQEIELKFLVPESRLKGLMRQTKVKSSQTMPLAAHYYDTPDQQLAQAGIGLRIRKEGEQWVQTIKAGGDGIAARLEHNAVLDNELVQAMLDDDALMPDLSLYKDTSIASALDGFKLKKLAKNLTRLYITDVERTTRLLIEDQDKYEDDQTDNRIEVAYDYGDIIHGRHDTERDAIQEIEFELLSGDLDFLFATAKTWCKRYKLCLSTVTKAERGGLLINQQPYSPAVGADLSQLNIHKKTSMPAFVRAVIHNCLLQILPNSSAIVAGSTDNEHILQLRLGIGRLRTAIKAFADFSDEINADWLPILKQTATLLGDYRQLSYLTDHIEPKLRQNGAPHVDWSSDLQALKIKPIDAVSANDLQLTLLELIAFTMSDPSLEPQADQRATDALTKILAKQYKKLLKADKKHRAIINAELLRSEAESITKEDREAINRDEASAQHKLRGQLKQLRYISEFVMPLLQKKQAKKQHKRWLKRLKKAQKSLGKYRDNQQYQQCYQKKSASDINALYGAGWFAATCKKDQQRSTKHLAKVKNSAFF